MATELHAGYVNSSSHREACNSILSHLFGKNVSLVDAEINSLPGMSHDGLEYTRARAVENIKVILILEFFSAAYLLLFIF